MKKLLIVFMLVTPVFVQAQYTIKSTMVSGKKTIKTTKPIKGYVITNSGEKKVGEIMLKIVNTDTTEIKLKMADKTKFKYKRLDLAEFGPEQATLSEVKKTFKNEEKNFHSGYVILKSGEKKEGKVATKKIEAANWDGTKRWGPIGVQLANTEDKITIYMAKDFGASYYMQKLPSGEIHYLNVNGVFVEVKNPNGRFSYYRNPNPTHIRKGATHLGQSVIQSAADEASEALVKGAAKRSFKKSMDSGQSLSQSLSNATIDAARVANETQGLIEFKEDEGLYFKEYYIIDNEYSTKSLVYKKNVKEVLSDLLASCGLEDLIDKKANSIKELEEIMGFLEKNICY